MDKIWDEWISEFEDEQIVPMTCETSEHMVSFEIENTIYTLEQSGEAGKLVVRLTAAQ